VVTLDDIRAADGRIRSIARRTPLLDVSGSAGRPLWLKCEHLQPGGAFKIRGATNMITQLSDADRRRGVITYSSGNHGQAVALAASRLGTTSVVVVPTTAPEVKIAGVRRWGGEVIHAGTTSIDRLERARAEAEARGLTMVPPFDHEWIIAGQGTCGLEILDQLAEVQVVAVPVGGGGLSSGVSTAIKLLRPDVTVIGVEPEGAAKMSTSLAAGHPVTLPSTDSIADGLITVRPGEITFEHVKRHVDRVITVSDREIAAAALWLFAEAKQVVEPSGAATVAAVVAERHAHLFRRDRKIVAILSGGNVSLETLTSIATLAS
jgi:threonine dehydratase